jgi:hypothetical protein
VLRHRAVAAAGLAQLDARRRQRWCCRRRVSPGVSCWWSGCSVAAKPGGMALALVPRAATVLCTSALPCAAAA